MPISESDYSYDDSTNDHYDLDHPNVPTSTSNRMMSKAELRKTHKPIMEKRRRAKINNCLNEIKDLILSAMKKDPERHSKLEKADILEMAVKHLKSMQKQQKEVAIRTNPTLAMKYKTGYLECASEVSSYVEQMDGVDGGLKQRLANHLNKCANSIERPQLDFTSSTLLASFAAQSRFNQNDDQNNNGRGMSLPTMQGIELIPSCLPNGDFAFLVPKSSFSSILNSGNMIDKPLAINPGSDRSVERREPTLDTTARPERPSAFVTVMPRPQNGLLTIAKPLSPPASPEMPKVSIIKPKAEKLAPLNLGALSTVASDKIQNIKFPINNHKKEHEPLSIITNAAERYRQAQRVDESRNQEENRYIPVFGQDQGQSQPGSFKRKAEGLLTVAPMKFARVESQEAVPSVSAFKSVMRPTIYECISDDDSEDMNRNDESDNEKNESMWRPW